MSALTRRAPAGPRSTARLGGMVVGFTILLLLSIAPVMAESAPRDFWDLRTFRFEFDNDNFVGSDDAFTAGWSFQFHSRPRDQWGDGLSGWIGKFPGLGDDAAGGRIVRWSVSLSQIIVTPADLSIEADQPDDSPWAGTLGVTGAWTSYSNRRLAALQIYFGCMGPCSHAEQIQKFVHEDLGWGEPPKGWDNQPVNQVLGNLNYEYRHKLRAARASDYAAGKFAYDMSVGGVAGAGNLATFVRGEIEFRFGWGLPMGFTKIPDPPGIGIVSDPVYLEPGAAQTDLLRWRTYFNVVARAAWVDYLAPLEGGETENGGFREPVNDIPGKEQMLIGLHLTRVPFGFNLTYYHYFDTSDVPGSDTIDWVNFAFEYRF